VGFLSGHRELNAALGFAALNIANERAMRANMEHWTAGNDTPTTRFHGFPNDPDHPHCFVFKHREHRLYGFRCHPKPKNAPRFQLCALCIYAVKFEWDSDKSDLDRVEGWLIAPRAVSAIATIYQEYRGEGVKWKM
jgi:hypothetical protein